MTDYFKRIGFKKLINLVKKLQSNERLNVDECMKLYELDLFTLAKFANVKRERLHGIF